MQRSHRLELQVSWNFAFHLTRDLFAPGNELLLEVLAHPEDRPARALVFLDDHLAAADPGLEGRIHRWFAAHQAAGVQLAAAPVPVPGGEAAKRDWSVVELVGRLAAEHGICRHSYVLAIGGGAVLDAVGLGAALVHRGLRLVRLPSTTLAQCDAGLGVKNAINGGLGKNFLGTFAPPWAVIDDLALLDLLDDRQWRAGIAEAVKVAVIKDATFLQWLDLHATALAARDHRAMAAMVERCALLHLDHITAGGDPFETGSSRPLDFGHWSAHRLELLSRHRLSHGEAVAIGVSLDLLYAQAEGRIATQDAEMALRVLERCGFVLHDPVLDLRDSEGRRQVLGGLVSFREHLGGRLTLAMPDGLGRRCDINSLDETLVDRCCHELRRRGQRSIRVEQR